MVAATARFNKNNWYTMPKDVVQVGTGNDANFFLPGTQTPSGARRQRVSTGGLPAPCRRRRRRVATSPCVYTGTEPPAQTPEPGPPTNPTPAGARAQAQADAASRRVGSRAAVERAWIDCRA